MATRRFPCLARPWAACASASAFAASSRAAPVFGASSARAARGAASSAAPPISTAATRTALRDGDPFRPLIREPPPTKLSWRREQGKEAPRRAGGAGVLDGPLSEPLHAPVAAVVVDERVRPFSEVQGGHVAE